MAKLISEGPVIILHIIPKSSMLKQDDSDWNNKNIKKIFDLLIFWLLGLHWLLRSPARHLVALAALNLAHSYVTVHFKMLPGMLPKQLL